MKKLFHIFYVCLEHFSGVWGQYEWYSISNMSPLEKPPPNSDFSDDPFQFGDEAHLKQATECAARNLIQEHRDITDEEVRLWTIPLKTMEIQQKILGWDSGGDTDDPDAMKVAYAKAYLQRLEDGIA
jgi:hypothetical protein